MVQCQSGSIFDLISAVISHVIHLLTQRVEMITSLLPTSAMSGCLSISMNQFSSTRTDVHYFCFED